MKKNKDFSEKNRFDNEEACDNCPFYHEPDHVDFKTCCFPWFDYTDKDVELMACKNKMTRKEAINEIQSADDPIEYDRAIDFALKALQTDVPRERFNAMIKAIDGLRQIIVKDKDGEADIFCSKTGVFNILKFFDDCEEGRQLMTREGAIEKIRFYCDDSEEIIKALEQEPKTGHWFADERPESDREIICSNCEQPIFKYHRMNFDYRPKYCPNCGAKMAEGGNDGET